MRVEGYYLIVALPLLQLAACSGDARPLQEAVEVNQLDLATLSIVPPASVLLPLVINSDQQVAFTLVGGDSGEALLSLSERNRRWSVTDPLVASITENGVLTGHNEGVTTLSVQVGEIIAGAMEVTVSDATLSRVERIAGAMTVDRCVPASYHAVGLFSDGSLRNLSEVDWSIDNGTLATVQQNPDGSAVINGINTGSVTLTGSSANRQNNAMVVVSDSLLSIDIEPDTLAVSVGNTQQLDAVGTYQTDTLRTIVITDAVQWQIISGMEVASIGNLSPSQGQVSGLTTGNATVQVSCGELQSTRVYQVINGNLTFEQDNPLELSLSGFQPTQLRVASGSSYASSNDVTDDATWSITEGASVIILNNSGSDKGEVTAQSIGSAIVQATYNGQSSTLQITVVE